MNIATAIPSSSFPVASGSLTAKGTRGTPFASTKSVGDERPRIVARVERAQIVDALPYADELDGKAELDRDRDRDASPGAPVELRERDSRDADGFSEEPRLLEPVLARGRVDDEQRLVGRAIDAALDHAAQLRELGHQVRLRVQAAGGVDDDDVVPTRPPGLDGVVRHPP